MDGILIVDKPKGMTSRDVVNKVCKILNTKKIGHTGTLDPIATGVLVLCVGKATKLVELLTCDDKEYVASVKVGIKTDSYDLDGNVLETNNDLVIKDKLDFSLDKFNNKKHMQEVPIYSAVKIDGKKLYEYARENKKVDLPKREVFIKNIELLYSDDHNYKFKVNVSKGTYIRSLIKDINDDMNVIGSMSDLRRTRQGIFTIDEACSLEDIENNNYNLISINNLLKKHDYVNIKDDLYEKIKHGSIIDNTYNKDMVVFVYNDNVIAMYKTYDKDNTKMKPYRMFI